MQLLTDPLGLLEKLRAEEAGIIRHLQATAHQSREVRIVSVAINAAERTTRVVRPESPCGPDCPVCHSSRG